MTNKNQTVTHTADRARSQVPAAAPAPAGTPGRTGTGRAQRELSNAELELQRCEEIMRSAISVRLQPTGNGSREPGGSTAPAATGIREAQARREQTRRGDCPQLEAERSVSDYLTAKAKYAALQCRLSSLSTQSAAAQAYTRGG